VLDLSSLVPISAVVAVTLFCTKECLEFVRRRDTDSRKISALKLLVARECELNHWTIKSYVRIVKALRAEAEVEVAEERASFGIVEKANGKLFFRTYEPDGSESGQMWMPEVHRDVLGKYLLEIATLDSEFFDVAEHAYDALAEVQHVQDHIRERQNKPEYIALDDYDVGLGEYSIGELNDGKKTLDKLYQYCTGKELTSHRLR
jgi:hypothetical protein